MATPWYGSHFLSLDDEDQLDDVFEPPPSAAPHPEARKQRKGVAEAARDYVHGHVGGIPTITVSHDGTDCQGLVTLHSLSSGQDSGYVPSPPSFHSFTSSSDEEEEAADLPKSLRPGVTPPISIPCSSVRPALRGQITHRSRQVASQNLGQKAVQDSVPTRQGRSKSCPATSRASAPPRLQAPHRLTFTPLAAHGSWCSMMVTGTNGPNLVVPPWQMAHSTTKASRDLKEEQGTPSHQCRVLVLALPDLVLDSGGRSPYSPALPSPSPVPPTRVRAFSCEVTLAEEVGKKLRWIADSFSTSKAQSYESPPTLKSNRGRRW